MDTKTSNADAVSSRNGNCANTNGLAKTELGFVDDLMFQGNMNMPPPLCRSLLPCLQCLRNAISSWESNCVEENLTIYTQITSTLRRARALREYPGSKGLEYVGVGLSNHDNLTSHAWAALLSRLERCPVKDWFIGIDIGIGVRRRLRRR